MSNITTIGFSNLELQALERLQPSQRFFVEAKNEAKIISLERGDALRLIYTEISKTIELSGENKKYVLDNDTLKNVAKFIYDFVCEHYRGITLSELKNAFKMGITGEYGDYVGYGTATFSKFLKGYMNSQKREAALKEWMKQQDVTQITNKPVTKFFDKNMEISNYFFECFDAKMEDKYDTVLNHNDNVMFLPAIFDFLFDNFQISFSKESADAISHKAKVKYNKFLVDSKIKKSDPIGYNNLVQSVINGSNRTFEYYTKLEALIFLTKKLKEQGKTYNNLKSK